MLKIKREINKIVDKPTVLVLGGNTMQWSYAGIFLKICHRYMQAMNITITSVMGKAIHTPVTWKIYPKKYAAGRRMITCRAAEIIMLGVPIESPCSA